MSRYIAIEGCKKCPHRHYYSAGAYECLKYGTVLPASHILDIPEWCPLPKLPTPASAQETGAGHEPPAEQFSRSIYEASIVGLRNLLALALAHVDFGALKVSHQKDHDTLAPFASVPAHQPFVRPFTPDEAKAYRAFIDDYFEPASSQPPIAIRAGDCVINGRDRKGVVQRASIVEVRWRDGGQSSVPTRNLTLRDCEEEDYALSPSLTKEVKP